MRPRRSAMLHQRSWRLDPRPVVTSKMLDGRGPGSGPSGLNYMGAKVAIGAQARRVTEAGRAYDARESQVKTHHKRRDVQGFRAIAVGLVVANHVTGHPRGGFIGVDVFFVLSGYLITGLLLREDERTSRISIADFYARRVRRIIPLALVVLFLTDVAAKIEFNATRAHQTFTDTIWAVFFGANVHFSRIGTNYFDLTRPDSPVQHFWSLAVEEQFYVVWPAVLIGTLWLCRRLALERRAVVGGVLAAIVLVSYVWCIRTTSSSPTKAYFSTPARAWELGLGALLAVAAPLVQRLAPAARGIAGWAGGALLVYSVFNIGTAHFPGAIAALPVSATVLLLASGEGEMPLWGIGGRWLLACLPMVFLGDISYSLYLWHWPVLVIGKAARGDTNADRLAFVGIAVALSAWSYFVVEKPILASSWLQSESPRDARRLPSRKDSALIAGVIAVLVFASAAYQHRPSAGETTAGVTYIAQNAAPTAAAAVPATSTEQLTLTAKIAASLKATSWPNLTPPLSSIASSGAPEWFKDHCLDVSASNVSKCVYGPAAATHHAVLLGDSYAISYLPGIRAALPPDWNLTVLTHEECLNANVPIYFGGVEKSACDTHRMFVEAEVAKIKPDAVIMADAPYLVGFLKGSDEERLTNVTNGLKDSLGHVLPYTKRIVMLTGPPSSGNLQTCVTKSSSPSDCTKALSSGWTSFTAAEKASTVGTAVSFVDTSTWFCANLQCPAVIGSTPVEWDGEHLTQAYSQQLAPMIANALELPE